MGLSLAIEINQLFTLYRATDINDLIANILGTVIGYLCFRFIGRSNLKSIKENASAGFLPLFNVIVAFLFSFIA